MITFLLIFIIFFVIVSVPCGIFVLALESRRRDAREAKEKAEQEKQKATQDERRELSEDEIKFIQEYRKKNEEQIAKAFSRDEEEKK